MALTENQFEEAVGALISACQQDETLKNQMLASITGNVDNLELSDVDLEAISGGGLWSWAKKKVSNAAYSIYNSARNAYNAYNNYY